MEGEDELEAPARRVDALPAGTEVRHVVSTKTRPLRQIPPYNRDAEHGVVRSYVRIGTLLSLSLLVFYLT